MPYSQGVGSDDKIQHDLSSFLGKEVIITEKMDGENTTFYQDYFHARSLDSTHHPSRDWVKGLWGKIKHLIPTGWRICGENLYAQHSIHYEELSSYFLIFSIWNDKNECLSWEETIEYATLLNLHTVPVLGKGIFEEKFIKNVVNHLDLKRQEGIVVRLADKFHFEDFQKSVVKWVRKNHVQTDEHWMNRAIVPNKLKEKSDF
ncbi:MAG: RNA ligase family protein [Flammeovirgaceae bacterium]